MRLVVAVVVVLAACGDGVGAPDATPPADADVGLVRVRYHGDVLENHPVFFQNADGSLVLATRTGIDGRANAYMAPGGYVTLIDIRPSTRFLYTWAHVEPGDDLVLDLGPVAGIDPTTTLTISIPIDPGASFYQLSSTCGSDNISAAAGTALVIELGDCRGHADMLVVAFGTNFRYIFAKDVPASDGSTVTLRPPYILMERSTVEVRNAPSGSSQMDVVQRLVGEGHERFAPINSGFGFTSTPLAGGAGTVNFDMPLPPAATMLTEVTPHDGFGIGRQHVARWESTSTTTDIDFAATTLRRYLSRPRYNPLAHAITWSEEATGTTANTVLATFTWFRPEIGGNYQWRIFAPRDADPIVKFPVLPDPQYLVREHDSVIEPHSLINIAVQGGYSQIRARLPITFAENSASDNPWPADGASGEVVYQELTPDQFPPD